jgi:hypothetical protein
VHYLMLIGLWFSIRNLPLRQHDVWLFLHYKFNTSQSHSDGNRFYSWKALSWVPRTLVNVQNNHVIQITRSYTQTFRELLQYYTEAMKSSPMEWPPPHLSQAVMCPPLAYFSVFSSRSLAFCSHECCSYVGDLW